MRTPDIIDTWIKSRDWKLGKFDLLPVSFGVLMSLLDVLMMGSAKMIKTGQISYTTGLTFSSIVYAIQPFLFIKALDFEDMVVVNLIWNLTSDVIVTLLGLFYFGEVISGLRWTAMVAAVIAIALFSYTDVTDT